MKMRLKFLSEFSPDRLSAWGRTLVAVLTWAGLGLWLSWRLAGWAMPMKPPVVAWSQPDPLSASEAVASHHWFGTQPPPEPPALVVLGVFAPAEERPSSIGFAVVQEAGQTTRWFSGRDGASGWTLTEVTASGIWLQRGEHRQFYPLHVGADATFAGGGSDMPPPPGSDSDE
jgi:hypothetical protein